MKVLATAAFFMILLLPSCASLQVYEPKLESNFTEETNFAGYDANSQIAWLLTKDDSNLYVRFETESRMSKLKILKAGFYIYFSTNGKKNRSTYLHFPIKKEKKIKADDEIEESKAKRRRGERFTTQDLIAKLDPEAKWVKDEESETFHYVLDTNTFKITIAEDSNTLMRYTLKIPFEQISTDPNQLENLVIGLQSGAFESARNPQPMPNTRPTSMGGTNMGGRNQMPNQGTTWQGGNYSELAEPVKIWFKVENIR